MNLNPEDVLVEDMQAGSGRTLLERRLRQNVVVDEFKKYPSAGAPVDNSRSGDFAQYEASIGADPRNPFSPFQSEIEWRFARWLSEKEIGVNATNELLAIPGFPELLNLSFQNAKDLHDIIDSKLSES